MNDCIFCKIKNKEIPSNFVYEDDKVMVIMDINPLCDGHMLVIPKEHYETVFDMPKEILNHSFMIAQSLVPKISFLNGSESATFSYNYGDLQEIKHAHMHVMPNFRKPASMNVNDVYKQIMENK